MVSGPAARASKTKNEEPVTHDFPNVREEEALELADPRFSALVAKHAELEHEIDLENHRPMPDTLHLTELKRQKLRVKEELERLSEEPRHQHH
jgi:hypothetical protein